MLALMKVLTVLHLTLAARVRALGAAVRDEDDGMEILQAAGLALLGALLLAASWTVVGPLLETMWSNVEANLNLG